MLSLTKVKLNLKQLLDTDQVVNIEIAQLLLLEQLINLLGLLFLFKMNDHSLPIRLGLLRSLNLVF